MNTKAMLVFGSAAALLCWAGCGKKGSGVETSEVRDVGAFTSISVEGAMRLDVTVGADRSVTVTGDDNLVPLVVTRVDGDELVVETSESYTTEIGLTAVVTVPKLTGVSISGAGKGHVKGLSNEGFEVDISGAAKLTLEGTTKTFSLDVSGASNVDATKLAAQDVKVSSSGASKLKVDAQKTLDVEVSGAGKVRYKGSPTVTKDISGAASVKAL